VWHQELLLPTTRKLESRYELPLIEPKHFFNYVKFLTIITLLHYQAIAEIIFIAIY
jgi:hypothetical protein